METPEEILFKNTGMNPDDTYYLNIIKSMKEYSNSKLCQSANLAYDSIYLDKGPDTIYYMILGLKDLS